MLPYNNSNHRMNTKINQPRLINKCNQSNINTAEGDDIDQPEYSRHSTRMHKHTNLFHPGIGPARSWSLDMVVNKALILDNHACKISDNDTEDLFSLSTEIDYMGNEMYPKACCMIKRYVDTTLH